MSLLDPDVFRYVLESLQAGVYMVDRSRRILCWNDGAERISGYLRQDVLGRICEESLLMHCDEHGTDLCDSACPLSQTLLDGKKREMSVYLRHKSGHLLPVHMWCVAIRDAHGNVIGASQSFDEHRPPDGPELRYQELATHGCLDPVIGLPNVSFTRTRLREQMGRFSEHQIPFSILIISLAADKAFRATHGQAAAERMLQPFTRLEAARSGSGTGLGLAIVARIAAMHGGEVKLLAREGGGLRARVTLASSVSDLPTR